jgi:hypothetical protein
MAVAYAAFQHQSSTRDPEPRGPREGLRRHDRGEAGRGGAPADSPGARPEGRAAGARPGAPGRPATRRLPDPGEGRTVPGGPPLGWDDGRMVSDTACVRFLLAFARRFATRRRTTSGRTRARFRLRPRAPHPDPHRLLPAPTCPCRGGRALRMERRRGRVAARRPRRGDDPADDRATRWRGGSARRSVSTSRARWRTSAASASAWTRPAHAEAVWPRSDDPAGLVPGHPAW